MKSSSLVLEERIVVVVVVHALAALLVGSLHQLLDGHNYYRYASLWLIVYNVFITFGTFGFAAAQILLIAVWAALGRGLYEFKLGVSLVAITGLLTFYWLGKLFVLMTRSRESGDADKDFTEFVNLDFRAAIALALGYFLIVFIFAVVSSSALGVRVDDEREPFERSSTKFQLSVRDLLLLTLLVAVLLGFGRMIFANREETTQLDLSKEVMIVAVVHALVTTPVLLYLAFRLMYRDGRARWRTPLLLAACTCEAVVFIVCWHLFFGGWLPFYWNEFGLIVALGLTSIVLTGAQVLTIHATLVPLRAVGLRVVRESRTVEPG